MTSRLSPSTSPYINLALEIGTLVTTKQQQYGNSFGDAPKILTILYPNGVQPDQYANLLTIVRVIDKLKRIATNHSSDLEDPWKDIIGYALLALNNQRHPIKPAPVRYQPASSLEAAMAIITRTLLSSTPDRKRQRQLTTPGGTHREKHHHGRQR